MLLTQKQQALSSVKDLENTLEQLEQSRENIMEMHSRQGKSSHIMYQIIFSTETNSALMTFHKTPASKFKCSPTLKKKTNRFIPMETDKRKVLLD